MNNLRGTTIFCDDIRQEISSKHILVGVYSGDMIPPNFPSFVTLALWVTVVGLEVGTHPFKIVATAPNGTPCIQNENVVHVRDGSRPTIFILGASVFSVDRTGDIVVTLSLSNGQPFEVGRIGVLSPDATPNIISRSVAS